MFRMRFFFIVLFILLLILFAVAQIDIGGKEPSEISDKINYSKDVNISCEFDSVLYEDEKDRLISVKKVCNEKNGTCRDIPTYEPYTELVNKTWCKENTITYSYKNEILDTQKNKIGCKIYDDIIVCDDDFTGDGNGDGICQSGETCYTFKIINDNFIIDTHKNGNVILSADNCKFETNKKVK